MIQANGGNGTVEWAGSGGGGRIAIVYNTTLQAAASVPTIQYQVAGAVSGTPTPGDIGTLYFPNSRLLTENMNWSGQVVIPGFTNWVANNLTLSNGWVRFPQDGFKLTVSNNLILDGSSARLQVGAASFRIINNMNNTPLFSGGVTASVLSVGGNVTLTNGACLYLYGAETNSGTPAFGALVSVAGDMYVGSNSWVYPQSHPTNGGSVRFQVRSLTVEGGTSGGFDANGPRGFSEGIVGHLNGFGPGGGQGGAWMGGGYGGSGGRASGSYGQTYGSSNAPVDPGSGGAYDVANGTPRPGGGLVYLLASRSVTLHGVLKANGTSTSWGSGAGSGGGIFIRCKTFTGSTAGSLQAKGGDVSNYSGGGGGGRIAVWRVMDQSDGPVGTSVAGGANLGNNGAPGGDGTLVWGWLPHPGTVISGR